MHFILEFLKQYQILALGGVGIITYTLKEIPKIIVFWVWEQITTSVVVNNRHTAYYHLLDYLSVQRRINFRRNLSLSNEDYWGVGSDRSFKLGFGITFLWYNTSIILIKRTSERVAGSDRPAEDLLITSFTRTPMNLEKLLKDADSYAKSKTTLQLYHATAEGWECLGKLQSRPIETVVLMPNIKQRLLQALDFFIGAEALYQNLAVSYKFNILLSGRPGTGKSSTILALATHLKRNLYFLRLNSLTPGALNKLLCRIVNGIIVIEELDTYTFSESRDLPKNGEKAILGLTLGDVLNTLDGILTKQGNIVIATTNYIDNLDSALIRDGRFDLKLELEYFKKEQMLQLIKRFYPLTEIDPRYLPETIAPATLQKLLFENLNDIDSFLDALAMTDKITIGQTK